MTLTDARLGGVLPGRYPNFVGRGDELDRLAAAFEAVAGGRTLVALVEGEAGIGKSRLVEEFCDRVRLLGADVARGFCVPVDGGLPYAPVMGILRDLGDRIAQHDPAMVLQRLHAAPVTVGSRDEGRPAAGEFARTWFFESMYRSLVELARAAPVVLVIEDLQWVDPATSQLLDFLVRNLGDARVLVLGTYRTEDFGHDHPHAGWLTELGRHPRVLTIELAGLARMDLAALVAET
ncbi:MAG: ATP-binding protein, partial [Jatrophihabitantaceae bacterium]